MIKLLTLSICFSIFGSSVLAQNVGIGTATPAATLHVKGNLDTTQFIIDASATQSNTHPLIRLRNASGTDIMHIHSDFTGNVFIGLNAGRNNTVAAGVASDGKYNVFIGSNAGYSNTTGYGNATNGSNALFSNTTGYYNTANGFFALYSNTTGNYNSANGTNSLYYNTEGIGNTANGFFALSSNTTGNFNTSNGYQSLFANTTGYENTANGANALANNLSGIANTAIGDAALGFNSTGNYNTGIGTGALDLTSAAYYNTAAGYFAGAHYDNGYNNVFLGANTDVNGAGYYNVIAIGQGTVCTGSSQVTLGNGATGVYRTYANWSNISDGRFKKNIEENVPGLDFISQLRPVTYNLNATGLDAFLHANTEPSTVNNTRTTGKPDEKVTAQPYSDAARSVYNNALKEKETVVYTGFVAQEVESAAKKLGFKFSGVDAPNNENDVYGLRYAEFVVPLVKAVQEQQQQIELLKQQNALLLKRVEVLEKKN
jgi:hypothetical protein